MKNTDVKKVLICGATSALAQSTARLFAAQGSDFFLAARRLEKLEDLSRDLKARGAGAIYLMQGDFTDREFQKRLLGRAFEQLGKIDLLFGAYGILPAQELCEQEPDVARHAVEVNFSSYVALLLEAAPYFEKQRSGTIAVISSVAGDRGRRSNYVYGSTKAGLDVFLEGFRARLDRKDIKVLTLKPGFVNTPMTRNMKQNFLFTEPAQAAQIIFEAIRKKRSVAYVPGYWKFVMLALRMIPETIFKRLSF